METIKLRRDGDVAARVTLARPERRNAVNAQMAEDFAQTITEIEAWGVPVAILDAEGPAFSAGVDLGDLDAGAQALDAMMDALLGTPIYWIAAVDGAVRGGSLGLLAVCPRVLATAQSSFGLPELARGFFPTDVVGFQAAALGARNAFDLAFRAEPIGAVDARAMGMVSAVVPGDLEAAVADELKRLTGFNADAIAVGVGLWQDQARRALAADAH